MQVRGGYGGAIIIPSPWDPVTRAPSVPNGICLLMPYMIYINKNSYLRAVWLKQNLGHLQESKTALFILFSIYSFSIT